MAIHMMRHPVIITMLIPVPTYAPYSMNGLFIEHLTKSKFRSIGVSASSTISIPNLI